jgi:carboxyl-terminal processing protease
MTKAIKFILNMKRLPIIVLIVAAGFFFAFLPLGNASENPPGKYEKILKLVGEMLTQAHYSPQPINDEFSKKIFKRYLTDLDPDKNIFLKSDVDALAKKYETRIDDEIKGAPVEFFLAAGKIFNQRMEEAALMVKEILEKPFNFTIDEDVVLDRDKLNYPATDAERKDQWRKKLKYMALDRLVDMQYLREKNKGTDGFVVKTDEELEKEARERVQRIHDRMFERYRYKFNDDDKFNLFVNAVTTSMDPHTEFFPPVEKRYFDEEMSGRFYGIGASLVYDDGNIKINSLIAGSPAWKSGELQPGDIILKVAQGNEEPVELTGYIVTDAVKIIRGNKGTEVRLTIKKPDGSIKVVSLIRDEIVQDETFARSAVVNNGTSKIGYIFLPEFYADFERPNDNRSYLDVEKEVKKLMDEKVDGIVIDLRNNGGGSLYDVVQMAGLFIEEGPIVQVKDRDNKPSVLRDKDRHVLYTGPLAVLVNEFSASASEIFAAAIQDYGRGVVIGSTSTYGKGTVQRNIGLDAVSGFSLSNSDLGTVKLTLQKFYRISGGSTQKNGVTPDIVLPDHLEYLKVREKDDPDALPWDEISKVAYTPWKTWYDPKIITRMSRERIENDPVFKTIKQNTEFLAAQQDKRYSLHIDKFRKEQEKVKTATREIESLLKLKEELEVESLKADEGRWSHDKNKEERFKQWLGNLRKDIYLDQAVRIMNDMVVQENLAKAKQAEPKKAF